MLFRRRLRLFALLFLPVLLALCGPGCTPRTERSVPAHSLLNEQQLGSTRFTVRAGRDTLLRSPGGTLLFVPRNGFLHPDGSPASGPVAVTVREALAPADMVLAHLTTTSDGRPLESGGMVFVDATQAGQPLRINPDAPLGVSLPTGERLPGMQVFTGQRDDAGRLNWVNPVPLADTTLGNRMALGARLFRANCAVCHALDSLVVRPPLATVHTRRQQVWLYAFIRNSMWLLQLGDSVTVTLYNQYNKQVMPAFDFTPKEIAALLTYLSGGSFRADSLEALPDGDVAHTTLGLPRIPPGSERAGFFDVVDGPVSVPLPADTMPDPLYYVFDLKGLGWINVDRFPDETTPRVPFFVRLAPEGLEQVSVTILFKKERVFLEARLGKNDRYTFSPYEDEALSLLPAGRKATVVVTAYQDGAYCLGLKDVVIGQAGTVTVLPARTTAEQLVKTLNARL
ncbi:MAG: cytochrome c [Cytophagales bacterium]|nr:cytochrome c [Cytophagales bacterium]